MAPGAPRRTRASKKSSEDQFMAAAIGDVEWLRQSLKEFGGPGEFDRNGLAAIHLAAIHGRLECLKLLIEQYKCNVNTPSSTGWRPVHLCISSQTGKRSLRCLVYLLEKGADHSCLNDDSVTPVHQAASEGHLQALELLVKLGAKLDQTDVRGFKPIDMAKIWGHKKCARLLATETWRLEKDEIAKKMRLQNRANMHQLLRQYENQHQLRDDKRYYGDEAFEQWVEQVEEAKHPKKPGARKDKVTKSTPDKKTPSSSDTKKTPPSSDTKKTPPSSDTEKAPPSSDTKKTPAEAEELSVTDLRDRVRQTIQEVDEALGQSAPASRAATSRAPVASGAVHHPQAWNRSTHVTDCFNPYQPRLEDAYPRDPYTMMPHATDSVPLSLNASSAHPLAALTTDVERQDIRRIGQERDEFSDEDSDFSSGTERDNSDREQSQQPQQPQEPLRQPRRRQQLFNCQSVLDIQRRKRLEAIVQKYRGEAALHLNSDPTSFLFRDALGPAVLEALPDRSSATSSASSRRRTPARLLTPTLAAS